MKSYRCAKTARAGNTFVETGRGIGIATRGTYQNRLREDKEK